MKFLHQIINKGNSKHTAFYFPFIKQESRKLKVGKLYNKYKRLPLTIIRKNKITIKKEKKKGEEVGHLHTSGMKITTGFGVWASNSTLFALSQPKT